MLDQVEGTPVAAQLAALVSRSPVAGVQNTVAAAPGGAETTSEAQASG